MGNLLRQCPIREHHVSMRKFVDEAKAISIDEDARLSPKNDDYHRGLVGFGGIVGELTCGIWHGEYKEPEPLSPDIARILMALKVYKSRFYSNGPGALKNRWP